MLSSLLEEVMNAGRPGNKVVLIPACRVDGLLKPGWDQENTLAILICKLI